MKRLTCEMCGSTDLVKQDGMYCCQSCGTKYTVEEAKKLMIEATVKIDNSDKLQNLYKIARQARDSNDSENAVKYYDLIKQEDPNSWEAAFYNVYYRAMQTKIMFIESAANSITNCLGNVFSLIRNYVEGQTLQTLAVTEIVAHIMMIGQLLESNARSTFQSSYDSTLGKYEGSADACMRYVAEYHSRAEAVSKMFFVLGDLIDRYFSSAESMQKMAATCWKAGVQYWVNDYEMFDERVSNKEKMNSSYGSKIRKYEPAYSIPQPNYNGYPQTFTRMLQKHSDDKTVAAQAQAGGGCYVATAVYGSYDCPEVWTLRRYRDYTLAKTWYGREFIRAYYAVSPTLVKWFGHTEWFKKLWKGPLDRMVVSLKAEGIEDTPYVDKTW